MKYLQIQIKLTQLAKNFNVCYPPVVIFTAAATNGLRLNITTKFYKLIINLDFCRFQLVETQLFLTKSISYIILTL